MKKSVKLIIICIVVIMLLAVGGVIGYYMAGKKVNTGKNTDAKVDDVTTTTTKTVVYSETTASLNVSLDEIKSKREKLGSSTEVDLWEIDYIYNLNINPAYDLDWKKTYENRYVIYKLENNKLMWNVESKWGADANITDDVKKIYEETLEEMPVIYVLTTKGDFYSIEYFENAFEESYALNNLQVPEYQHPFKSVETLSSNGYKKLKYTKYNISNVEDFDIGTYCECGCANVAILKANDINYYCVEGSCVDSSTFLENITKYATCGIESTITITTNREAKGIYDENNNLIKVKYYYEFLLDGVDYNLLVADDNKIYTIVGYEKNKGNIQLESVAKAKEVTKENGKVLSITLDNGNKYSI